MRSRPSYPVSSCKSCLLSVLIRGGKRLGAMRASSQAWLRQVIVPFSHAHEDVGMAPNIANECYSTSPTRRTGPDQT